MSNRAKRAQQIAIDEALENMVLWYMFNTDKPDEIPEIAVDRKAYKGIVMRWIEPILPHVTNPILIEEEIKETWTLRTEAIGQKFKIT